MFHLHCSNPTNCLYLNLSMGKLWFWLFPSVTEFLPPRNHLFPEYPDIPTKDDVVGGRRISRNFWSKWKKRDIKKWGYLFLLLQPSLLPASTHFNTDMPWLLVATLICDTLMAHSIFFLHGPMGTTPDCHAYWFFSHPIEASQLPPQSVGGGETSLQSRTNVCSQHCSWNNPHAALSLFHLLLLG